MKGSVKTQDVLCRMMASVPEHVKMRMDLSIRIADRIVELMEGRGMSSRQMAEAMGVRPSVAAQWISGQYNFDLDTLARLSVLFRQPIIAIID